MRYSHIEEGFFISRPNRFIANVQLGNTIETCHVKNTGRCKEILIPGARVLVNKAQNPNRKTKYDLVAAYKGEILINIDSQAPNHVFLEAVQDGKLFKDYDEIRGEVVFEHSRFDFWLKDRTGQEHFIEVKGVTLEVGNKAFFPDAPTQRGIKHIYELMKAKEKGYKAHLYFLIQLKGVSSFSPNNITHPAFGQALLEAEKAGVHIRAYDCVTQKDGLYIDRPVPVILTKQ